MHTQPPAVSIDDSLRPDALVVFDGACNLCSWTVRVVLRMDRAGLTRFTAAQSHYGRALCEAEGLDPSDPSTFLFFDRGRAFAASQGAVALLSRMPSPWRWLRWVGLVPRPLRDAAYLWVARHRHRLFGQPEVCMIPAPEVRARFIDDIPIAP